MRCKSSDWITWQLAWQVILADHGVQEKDRCGARWALVLGDEEVEKGEVRIKPLSEESDDLFLGLHDLSGLLAKLTAM